MIDYYAILQVKPTADRDTIRRAYRRLAFELHPDRHHGGADAEREERFKQLATAYRVLADAELRAHYDASRRRHLSHRPARVRFRPARARPRRSWQDEVWGEPQKSTRPLSPDRQRRARRQAQRMEAFWNVHPPGFSSRAELQTIGFSGLALSGLALGLVIAGEWVMTAADQAWPFVLTIYWTLTLGLAMLGSAAIVRRRRAPVWGVRLMLVLALIPALSWSLSRWSTGGLTLVLLAIAWLAFSFRYRPA